MNVKYYKDAYRLVNTGDVHDLGQDFDEAIILLSALFAVNSFHPLPPSLDSIATKS